MNMKQSNNRRKTTPFLTIMVVVLVFPVAIGYFETKNYFSSYMLEYACYSFVCLISSVVFISAIHTRRVRNIYKILIILFYCSYVAKFYLMVALTFFSDVEVYRVILYSSRILEYMKQDYLIASYKLVVLSYFCLSILAHIDLCKLPKEKNAKGLTRRITSKSNIIGMTAIVIFLFLLVLLTRQAFSMTDVESYLIVLSIFFVPLLYVYLLNASLISGYKVLAKKIAYIFITSGLIQFLFFYSKMFVALPFVWIVILQNIYKVKIINNKVILLLSIPLIALYPIFNIYREAILLGSSQVVSYVIDTLLASEVNIFLGGVLAILHRFVGFDSLLVLVSERSNTYFDFGIIELIIGDSSITHILTYDILGYGFVMGVAPTLLGQIYFISGSIALSILLFTIYVYSIANMFEWLISQNSLFIRTISIYLIVYTVIFFNEGILFSNFKYQLFGLIVFAIFYRLFSTKKIYL